ncbi:MAG: DHHW family protein [Saccharofermentanales bacterium]|jgi:hypothetical protein
MRPRKRTRQINQMIALVVFLVTLLVFGILHIILPDQDISVDEGRELQSFPKLTYEDLRSGELAPKMDGWYNDQFPFRDGLLSIGNAWRAVAYPNLNADGVAILPVQNLDVIGKPGTPDATDPADVPPETTPVETAPKATDPEATVPATTMPPTTTEPPKPPPLPAGNVDDRTQSLGVIILNNRIMERYYGTPSKLEAYGDRLSRLNQALPDTTTLYSLIVPTAIEIYGPDAYHAGYSSQKDCIDIVRTRLDSDIESVRALENLLLHRDEYLYFRTDHHWTMRGAYYAYVAFCESAGLTPVPMDQMEHYELEGTFLGSLYRLVKDQRFQKHADTTEGWRPNAEYTATAWDKGDMKSSYQIRLNDTRVKGAYSYLHFSGGDRALLKITTNHQSGRRIVMIKDSFGNAFTPLLANHFDEIYVIDPRYYERDLMTLIRDEDITDVLILNGMFSTSGKIYLDGFDAITP